MSRRTVIIPLVSADGGDGELLELYCEPSPDTKQDEDDRKRGIEPIIESLRPINLHISGQQALAAVQKLLDNKAKQRFKLDRYKIRYSNRPSSSSIEGESAQLGIALLLLMSGGQSAIRSVITTGRLDVNAGKIEFDALIEAVNSLDKKLSRIFEAKRRGQLNKISKVLIPVSKVDTNGKLIDISAQCAELEKLGMQVAPVRTLKEAASQLNINLTGRMFGIQQAVLTGLLVVAISSVIGMLGWIFNQDIPVKFEAKPTAGIPGKPFIVCTDARGNFVGYEPILLEGLKPVVPVTGTLGWRVQLGDPAALDARLLGWLHRTAGYQGYHVVVAFVGEHSGLRVLATEGGATEIRKLPGTIWEWSQQVAKPAEAGVLVFLVRRINRFELDAVRARFQEQFAGNSQDGNASINLTLAADSLAAQATGSLRYFFESVDRPSPCGAPPSTSSTP